MRYPLCGCEARFASRITFRISPPPNLPAGRQAHYAPQLTPKDGGGEYIKVQKEAYMLIQCPECKKEVSDAAQNCPHCGYAIKKAPENKSSKETNKSAAFQFLAIGACIIAIFTPKIIAYIPLIIACLASIIALIRKEPRWILSLIVLLFSFWLITSISSDISHIGSPSKPDYSPFTIKVTRFTADSYDYYKVIGYIINNGKESYRI